VWLVYSSAGHTAAVKQHSVDLAMNARGMRAPARVWPVSPTTMSNA